eukprot:CAMPEP_0172527116 /NCGR_PEP_ID=MMETSP1067-20121228/1875_1 /TAXON_ID=265564 ORGANISM="Thalassiosira punctigera, Strain Tpunct2005C2" /NCGR_SAMPLE_ID=MMETSP1067 /ASSEMBLY_ACC=CAM_ASM_000444 /LENGTH=259 /DNA_ID=CAMNT_0013310783 /DNA_START=69 /DNA_END=848 /DNA_ORIENTATION=+
MRLLALATSIPSSWSEGKCHIPAFTSYRNAWHHQSNVVSRDSVAQSSALLSAASNDDNGRFLRDDSGGNFFEEVESPKSRKDEEEAPMTLEELELLATPFDEHLPKINTVTLVGRVGNEPEPRYFEDGKVVLNLSLAVRRKYHPLERKVRNIRSGDEETDWFTLEFWGRDAEYITNYVEKGARLGITGSLVVDGWADKMTGEQRRKPKIIVSQTDILESRAEAELRKGNRGKYDGGSDGKRYDDKDDGLSPAGTGGFFS